MPVPCGQGGTMPLFRTLWSDIGDEQNVENDLSTFSAHVRNIAAFLPSCTEESVVLLDELFAGTDPEQGAALGRALLEELASRGTWVVVTTHLEKLKTLAFEDGRFACASVGFDVDRLQPTFALRMGVPGGSYALRIAARLGLSAIVVERAETMLGEDGSANREEILDRMQREMSAIADERQELARMRREAQAALKEADAKRKMARTEMDKELRDEERQLRSALDELRRDIRLQSARLKETGGDPDDSLQAIRRQTTALEKSGREVSRQLRDSATTSKSVASAGGPALDVDSLNEGDTVFVVPFKKSGVVASKPRRGERVTVQVGAIRATFAAEDLRALTRNETVEEKTTVKFARVDASNDVSTTLDLRGTVVDDAMEQLDVFLDRAERARLFQVVVIHGHGTGALKRAVRGYLGESRRGFHYRPGERSEGGDGVTVVYLDGVPSHEPGSGGGTEIH
jgi:DNA mismatch repair protein MutS2